jgi:hypothetical protein
MSRRRGWILRDPTGPATPEDNYYYVLPVNPSEDSGSHAIRKNTGFETKSGLYQDSFGVDYIGSIVFFTNFEVEKFSYSGKTYNEQDHLAMESWMSKDYPVELTDDLGRTWLILTESFTISRIRGNVRNPFKHQYNWTGFVLEEIEDV